MDDLSMSHLKTLVVSSNEALEFKLIRNVEDLDSDKNSFKPEMSHQVFGDSESIFGYRDLKVKLYYAAGCLETYLGMIYSEKVDKATDAVEPDEVLSKLVKKLAPNVHYNVDTFMDSLKKDDVFMPFGKLLHSFSIDDNGSIRQFEIYKADMSYKGYREYHQRLQTFVLWYIDAANFIDIDDEQWQYFNIFEKFTTTVGTFRYATIGMATVYHYYAYPGHIRPRIAQVLILPPFQNIGLGTHLLQTIYRQYTGRIEIKDITVEDPSMAFQRLRDYIDSVNCSTLPGFKPEFLRNGFQKTMIDEAREKFKINKKQTRRVYEILRLRATDISNKEEYRAYRLDVKRRLNIPYRREENDMKKLERALKNVDKRANIPQPEQRMQSLDKEFRLLEEEYRKIIQRMEDAPEL